MADLPDDKEKEIDFRNFFKSAPPPTMPQQTQKPTLSTNITTKLKKSKRIVILLVVLGVLGLCEVGLLIYHAQVANTAKPSPVPAGYKPVVPSNGAPAYFKK